MVFLTKAAQPNLATIFSTTFSSFVLILSFFSSVCLRQMPLERKRDGTIAYELRKPNIDQQSVQERDQPTLPISCSYRFNFFFSSFKSCLFSFSCICSIIPSCLWFSVPFAQKPIVWLNWKNVSKRQLAIGEQFPAQITLFRCCRSNGTENLQIGKLVLLQPLLAFAVFCLFAKLMIADRSLCDSNLR